MSFGQVKPTYLCNHCRLRWAQEHCWCRRCLREEREMRRIDALTAPRPRGVTLDLSTPAAPRPALREVTIDGQTFEVVWDGSRGWAV